MIERNTDEARAEAERAEISLEDLEVKPDDTAAVMGGAQDIHFTKQLDVSSAKLSG